MLPSNVVSCYPVDLVAIDFQYVPWLAIFREEDVSDYVFLPAF
jgi:hypothetical protein